MTFTTGCQHECWTKFFVQKQAKLIILSWSSSSWKYSLLIHQESFEVSSKRIISQFFAPDHLDNVLKWPGYLSLATCLMTTVHCSDVRNTAHKHTQEITQEKLCFQGSGSIASLFANNQLSKYWSQSKYLHKGILPHYYILEHSPLESNLGGFIWKKYSAAPGVAHLTRSKC